MTATHTTVDLELSPEAHKEIETKLRAAGYGHAIRAIYRCIDSPVRIDMTGIALVPGKEGC
jgi:hypothetical protein